MARPAEPYSLKKRAGYWYFRIRGETVYHSTGIPLSNERASRPRAEAYASRRAVVRPDVRVYGTFASYAVRYFLDETCPWWTRQIGRGKTLNTETRRQHRSRLEIHILPTFGRHRLDELSPNAIEQWLYELDYSSQTKRHIFNTLAIILKDLRRDQLVSFDPREIAPPIPRNNERAILTDRQATTLFPDNVSRFRHHWGRAFPLGVMCALLYSSGLRTSEARALEWNAVDPLNCGIKVIRTVNRDGRIGPPKANSFRAVIIPRWTMHLLAQLPKPRTGCVFGGRTPGTSLQIDSVNHALQRALTKLPNSRAHITPHGLRHGYNTRMRQLLAAAGMERVFDNSRFRIAPSAADEILRSLTGHKSVGMTELYDHPELTRLLRLQHQYIRPYVERFWCFRQEVQSQP